MDGWVDGQVDGDGWMCLKNISFPAEQTGKDLTRISSLQKSALRP